MPRIGRSVCPYCCGSSHIYVSRFKSLWEVAASLLLLRPVRCHDCLSRFYRPVFMKTLPVESMSVNSREAKDDPRRAA